MKNSNCSATLRMAALAGCIALIFPSVHAQQTPAADAASTAWAVDLPAQPVIASLRRLAEQTGARIRFDVEALRGLSAPAVKGSLTLVDALKAAVNGTGLEVVASADQSFTVKPVTLKVVVTALRTQGETSFKADRSETSSRADVALLDSPTSVTVITSQVLQSQMTTDVKDALANVSGVNFTQSPQGRDSFSIRGNTSTSVTSNGLADPFGTTVGVVSVERIEVLKGPQAVLAGSNALGGGVNIVLKRPQAERVNAFTLQYGSRQSTLGTADLSGMVLGDDPRLTYRLTASRERDGNNASGFHGKSETSTMPQLRWKDNRTDLVVGVSFDKQHRPVPTYTVADPQGKLMPRPAERIGTASDGFESMAKRGFYDLSERLTDNLTLVSRLQRTTGTSSVHLYSLLDDLAADGTSTVYGGATNNRGTETAGDHYLRALFSTGPIDHKLALGINHSIAASVSDQLDNYNHYFPVTLYPAQAMSYEDPYVGATTTNKSLDNTRERGYYLQDYLSWNDWSVMVAVRRSHYHQSSQIAYPSTPEYNYTYAPLNASVSTPSAGLVYKIGDDASLFANFSKGFVPQSATTCGGGNAPPVTTVSREIGAKWDLAGGKLALTTSLFELAESDTLQYNLAGECYTLIPDQRTKGVEVDVQGEVRPGWDLIANYTFNHTNNPSDPTQLFAGKPKHKFSAWSVHALPVPTLKAGVGLTLASPVQGSSTTSAALTLPQTFRLDASLTYTLAQWDLQLMAHNLTDHKNYVASGSGTYVPIDDMRGVTLRVSRDFK